MSKNLIVSFVVAFMILTVMVAVISASKGAQWRPSPPETKTTQTLNSDTPPLQFPRR